jgi:hypothetical protein
LHGHRAVERALQITADVSDGGAEGGPADAERGAVQVDVLARGEPERAGVHDRVAATGLPDRAILQLLGAGQDA